MNLRCIRFAAICLPLLFGCTTRERQQLPISKARLLVVSDVDDTVKDTHVTLSRSTHLKNPLLIADFAKPWSAVRGMPCLYREWKRREGAEFAYVSNGPRAYERRVKGFLIANDFPTGPILLNPRFPMSGPAHKEDAVAKLLVAYPRARVVLIGDSGERDPKIFATLLRRFPNRIAAVFIRAVTTDAGATVATLEDFRSAGKWTVFREPEDIASADALHPRARSN